jgi:hypothetical protein
MLKIIKVKATDEFLKIYLLKLHEIGFLKYLNFKDEIFNSLIHTKSFQEINSKELFECCPDVFTGFIPKYLFYVSDHEIDFKNVFEFPVLYASIEKLGDYPFYEARYGLFPQTGCNLLDIKGRILKSIQPESLYEPDIIEIKGKYQMNVDSDRHFLLINQYSISHDQWFREIYYIEEGRIVDINEMTNITIIVDAIQKHGSSFIITSKLLRDKKEVILAAVEKDGSSLKFASEDLRNDKAVVLAAVKNFGPALEFASKELQSDKEVQNNVIHYFEEKLENIERREYSARNNHEWDESGDIDWYNSIVEQISNEINWLKVEIIEMFKANCSVHLKDDQDFIQNIFKIWPHYLVDYNIIYTIASKDLLTSNDFLLCLLKLDSKGTPYWDWSLFPSSYWADQDRVRVAVEIDEEALKYVSVDYPFYKMSHKTIDSDQTLRNLLNPDDNEEDLPF